MALEFRIFIAAFAVVLMVSFVQGNPQIVAPYPLNLFSLEDGEGQVSCVATDTTGAKPDRIDFFKIGDFGAKKKIADEGPSGRVYYTNRTEDNGKKLITTLRFNKVKIEDSGGYECIAYSSGKSDASGFSVNVIPKSDLPTAKMEGATVLLGKPAKLYCNITLPGFTDTIKYILWIKNSEIVRHVLSPAKPYNEALTFNQASLQDSGVYTCAGLVSWRRGGLERNMTFGTANLKVEVEVVVEVNRNTSDVYAVANNNATLDCPISGESVEITWLRVGEDGSEAKLNMSQRFTTSKACPKCHSILTIINLETRDQGKYVCKAKGAASKHFFDLFVNPAPTMTTTTEKPTVKSGSVSSLYGIQSTSMLLSGLVAWLCH